MLGNYSELPENKQDFMLCDATQCDDFSWEFIIAGGPIFHYNQRTVILWLGPARRILVNPARSGRKQR